MAGGWWLRSRNRTAAEGEGTGPVRDPHVPRPASIGATGGTAPGGSITANPWPTGPQGATEQYPPRGATEQYPPRGATEQYPPRGATEQYPPQGATEQYPPRGATEQYPPLGREREVELPFGTAGDPSGAATGIEPRTDDLRQGKQPGSARLARSVAAEVGMYAGAALVATAGLLAGYAAWPGWSPAVRATVLLTAGIGALAGAVWLRASARPPSPEARERAVSALFAAGLLVLVGAGCVLAGGAAGPTATILGVGLVGMVALTRAYRTAATETGVLAMALWLALAASSTLGVWLYPVIATLGGLWAVLGWRWARGQRTAAVTGTMLGLGACVAAANGVWAWPARVAILSVGAVALLRFWRGGRNFWLALGIVAMATLAATLAGAALSPLLALAAGGVAVFLVSWAALRAA